MERRTGGSGRTHGAYVYGTAARQLNTALPKTDYDEQRARRKREQEERRQQERLESYKALKHAHKTNLLYTFAAVAVAAFMFAICVQYLEAQAYVKNTADEVASMEIKLTQLSVKNDETKMEIDGGIDYNEVLRVATEELGMVYPKRSQIVEYDAAESEYVKQYKNIPSTGK